MRESVANLGRRSRKGHRGHSPKRGGSADRSTSISDDGWKTVRGRSRHRSPANDSGRRPHRIASSASPKPVGLTVFGSLALSNLVMGGDSKESQSVNVNHGYVCSFVDTRGLIPIYTGTTPD
eukprot:GHVO01005917.1.p1 GENE.GHVO01005917.1~~GHVO01005917.1.p1  ORF type:complete len:136 (+),score=10.22 GHVO01005917.1:43-408(+)